MGLERGPPGASGRHTAAVLSINGCLLRRLWVTTAAWDLSGLREAGEEPDMRRCREGLLQGVRYDSGRHDERWDAP